MILKSDITAWSKHAPWRSNYMVEQDLIIERALIEIFSNHELSEQLAFRGGTAIHKLYFQPQPRYSEDIDFVQRNAGSIGDILTLLREKLSFMGIAKHERGRHSNKLIYRFNTAYEPIATLKLKIEINTREHFTTLGYKEFERSIETEWFTGKSKIISYELEELLGTKLRALYQSSKGRDLFDLWYANNQKQLNEIKIIEVFRKYISHENLSISREEFNTNMEEKISDSEFLGDIAGLLRPGIIYDPLKAWKIIQELIVDKI